MERNPHPQTKGNWRQMSSLSKPTSDSTSFVKIPESTTLRINIFIKEEQQLLETKQNPEHNHCLILQIY